MGLELKIQWMEVLHSVYICINVFLWNLDLPTQWEPAVLVSTPISLLSDRMQTLVLKASDLKASSENPQLENEK